MEYYILISTENFIGSNEFYNKCSVNLFHQIESSSEVRVHVMSESLANNDDWITDEIGVKERLQNNFGASSDYISFKLHSLADCLIEKDVRILKLFWFIDNNINLILDKTIHLYGALLRFKNWHGAKLYLIDQNYIDISNLSYHWQVWKEKVSMFYGGFQEFCNLHSIILNPEHDKIIPFQLSQIHENCHLEGIFSGYTFFKGFLNYKSISKNLISTDYFKFDYSETEWHCFEKLQNNNDIAALLEIPYSFTPIECFNDKRYTRNNARSGLNWRKYFVDNTVNNHNQVLKIRANYNQSYFFIVTTANLQNKCELIAIRMKYGFQLHEAFEPIQLQYNLTATNNQPLIEDSPSSESMNDFVIPVIHGIEDHLQKCLNRAKQYIFEKLADENGNMRISKEQYIQVMQELEIKYLKDMSSNKVQYQAISKENYLLPLLKPIQRDNDAIKDRIEWKRLSNRNENKKKKIIELSPPNQNEIRITAAEFIRIYKENNSELSPLNTNSDCKTYCNVEKQLTQLKEYPLNIKKRCHDIYYENREENFEAEKVYNELVKRLRSIETDSTLGTDQNQTFLLSINSEIPSGTILSSRKFRNSNSSQSSRSKEPINVHSCNIASNSRVARLRRNDCSRSNSLSSSPRTTKSSDVRSVFEGPDEQIIRTTSSQSSETCDNHDMLRRSSSITLSNSATPFSTPASVISNMSESEKRKAKSDKHKLILQDVVTSLLKEKKLTSRHSIFNKCASRLYKLTKSYIQDIKTSSNIREDMLNIARSHVKTVIEFEKKNK